MTSRSAHTDRLLLPPPGGPHQVGTQALCLLDPARADPWQAHRRRKLMVQLWYPASACAKAASPTAHYLTPSVAAHVLQMWAEEGRCSARTSAMLWPEHASTR